MPLLFGLRESLVRCKQVHRGGEEQGWLALTALLQFLKDAPDVGAGPFAAQLMDCCKVRAGERESTSHLHMLERATPWARAVSVHAVHNMLAQRLCVVQAKPVFLETVSFVTSCSV